MPNSDIDKAFERFRKLVESLPQKALSESDSRAKIIDPILKDCLGWDEGDITREESVHPGFIDYVLRIDNRPILILEAKQVGSAFTVPLGSKKRRYKISGSISTDRKIKQSIDQAHKYSVESGTTFAVISNGQQFIIFESFKHGGRWKDGFCVIFGSFEDIMSNFTLFHNILSKERVTEGSLRKYVSEEGLPLDFKRPLDFVHNEDATCARNFLATHITPIISYIFKDLTADSQIEILRKCYVRQKQLTYTDAIMRSSFDKMPYYSEQFDINWFKESETESGEFQISFDKCKEFLRTKTPIGSMILLLGGIGSGKTTFVHHFFKVVMADRDDILWFYVDFGVSPPELGKVEQFIYDSIIEHYESRYKTKLQEYLKSVGLGSIRPNDESLLAFFTMLRYKGYAVSIVLDNVDQHSYVSPQYQERVFELAQNLTHKFKTITILTLREESFFRSTRSGVLGAYHIPMFHIESPNFEYLIRNRINYTLEFLSGDQQEILRITRSPFGDWNRVKLFFIAINHSIRQSRRVGADILKFINDVSGGNMRQALRFISSFITSGNTDVAEMIGIESQVPPDSPPYAHYQIPLHHIMKSIILEDKVYYTSSQSYVMNLFQVNPQHTNSHFIHLRVLDYLCKRTNYFTALEKGFVDIDQIIEDAEVAGISQRAIEDSLKKLAHFGLVEYDNQNKEGYDTAKYVKITVTGLYYFEYLVTSFPYLDLAFMDTPICDDKTVRELRNRLDVDPTKSKKERMEARFERTKIFLEYLKKMEEDEFKSTPSLSYSDIARMQFMESILEKFDEQVAYIRQRIERERLCS